MYAKPKLCLIINGTTSDWFSVVNGVKQEGVVSPMLFVKYYYYYKIFYSNTFTIKGLVHIHTAYYLHLYI